MVEISPDIGAEVILKLETVLNRIENMKKELIDKDKKIEELEAKLKKSENGS